MRTSDGAPPSSITFSGEPWRNVTDVGNDLFVMINDLRSLNLATQRVQWLVKNVGENTAWPYVWRGEVLQSDTGHLYAYRESDGSLAWSHSFPGQLVRGIGVTPNLL